MGTSADLLMAYSRGWIHSAGGKPIDTKLETHKDDRLRSAYCRGLSDGRDAKKRAFAAAETEYGCKASVIREAKSIASTATCGYDYASKT